MIDLELRGEVRQIFEYGFWKSVFDRSAALISLIVLSPLMLFIAIGIRLDSTGNPIFSQERVGEKGRGFIAYKFRTMKSNNDDTVYKSYIRKYVIQNYPYKIGENGQKIYKVVDDPRITRFGSFLRKSNLDELPQLFNLLKGDMSFVGPRPDIPFAVNMYQDWHRKRLSIMPGLTGLWQVYGRRNLSFEEMVRLDITYIENQSFLLDARILLKTIYTVLTGDGS